MRFVVYAVAAVLLAGFGARLVAGLPLQETKAPDRVTHLVAAERVVYVNKSELAKLHPGWAALEEMRTTLAEVGSASGGVSFKSDAATKGEVEGVRNTSAGVSRKALEAEAAQAAVKAYDELESQKLDALHTRSRAMRGLMMKSAESSIMAEARNIEESAAADMKKVDDLHRDNLVSAQLKAAALKVQTKVSGIDQKGAEAKLKSVETGLDGASSAADAEKDKISAVAEAKIQDLRKTAESRIDVQKEAFEAEESARIAKGIKDAREQIITEIGAFRMPVLGPSGRTARVAAPSGGRPTETANGDDLARLRASATELEAKIAKDVDRMVADLAARHGMKVTFKRDGSRAPDATRLFADLMRKSGWSASEPVLGGLGSS